MKILYICTHNRCRSILSEAITNHIAGDLIEARSAGSQPVGEVHPLSLKYLNQEGFPTNDLHSQSWDDFEGFNPDIVITVCDSAAGESCPLYFSTCTKVHWGLSDPSKIEGDETEQEEAFLSCIEQIKSRAKQLVEIASKSLNKSELRQALANIGAK